MKVYKVAQTTMTDISDRSHLIDALVLLRAARSELAQVSDIRFTKLFDLVGINNIINKIDDVDPIIADEIVKLDPSNN